MQKAWDTIRTGYYFRMMRWKYLHTLLLRHVLLQRNERQRLLIEINDMLRWAFSVQMPHLVKE